MAMLLGQMSDFKAKNAPNSILAGALPQTPLGELTALHQILAAGVGAGWLPPSKNPTPASALRASILCAFGASVGCHPSQIIWNVPDLCHDVPRLGKTSPGTPNVTDFCMGMVACFN